MILQIFSAATSETLPPTTVKSWEKTQTGRPSIVPKPVTTESPGKRCWSTPKSLARCRTRESNSSKLPGSTQQGDALAGRELAALVLGLDAPQAAAEGCLLLAVAQVLESLARCSMDALVSRALRPRGNG